jgi:hypothetical protein
MMNLFLLSVATLFLCVSCAQLPTPYPNGKGGVAKATIVGGDGMYTVNADGSTAFTYKQTKSLQHVAQAVTSLGLGYIGYLTNVAKEITARLANDNLTSIERLRLQTQLSQVLAQIGAQTDTTNTAIGAGAQLAPITVHPPGS